MTKEEIESKRFLYQIYATIILFVILMFVSNMVLKIEAVDDKIPAQFDDAKLPATFFASFIISMIVYFASGFAGLAKNAHPDV
jgi:hypothetical protein